MTLICFADTRFPIERANGVQTMATCHGLAARGHDVTLVVRGAVTSGGAPHDPFTFYGLAPVPSLHIDAVATPAGARARRVAFLLAALARAARADRGTIVFTRDLGVAAFLLQAPGIRRPPVVYESHGISAVVAAEMPRLLGKPELAPTAAKLRRLDRRERRVWRHAAGYVTITRALLDDLTARYGPREHVHVVPDGGIPVEKTDAGHRFPGPHSETDARHRFSVAAYAGHLYPWKGVDVFVRALAQAPAVHGLIVGGHPGEADLARVQGLARELGLDDRLTFTGLIAPTQVAAQLGPADILVLPNTASAISERYTSPLKLFEYLMLGRAIVASDLPAIREVLTHGRTALLVPPGDPAALAAALTRLADDATLRQSLADEAARLAPSFTWAKRAERLEAVLAAVAR